MTDTPSRSITSLADEVDALLARLGVEPGRHKGGTLVARTPITGEITGRVHEVSAAQAAVEIDKAHAAFLEWRQVPAPKRGELVRLLGEELRANKEALGRLVSIEVGKMADLVLWPRASFGLKPYMVIKNGFPVWAAMGDGNGSLGLSEPMIQKRMWGALGAAPQRLGVNFMSKLAVDADIRGRLGLGRATVQIKNVRRLRKTDMIRNAAMPHVEVDPQTFEVRADGKLLMCPPATTVPLARRFMLR
ncbi:MAG: aldehyde dehydrogenase family protein [Bradyrhizobium sp.]|nr:aldehyde dehydrogenase family protein [Bradyrhizobium sp.]